MTFWIWAAIVAVLAAAFTTFIIVARKGRALRTNLPLPPEATKAVLDWNENGNHRQREVSCPFYLGKSAESDIRIAAAKSDYEVCIFYHDHRFAMQTLPGARQVMVNGEEMIAGYLRDGDELSIGDQNFKFRCW